jgi:hypothetical protein
VRKKSDAERWLKRSKATRYWIVACLIAGLVGLEIGLAFLFDAFSVPWLLFAVLADGVVVAWLWKLASDPHAAVKELEGYGPEQSRNRRMP